MSIYTDMINAKLQINQPIEGASGAQKDNYVEVKEINISIYKSDSFKSVQSSKYEESTHNGITFEKGFVDGYEYRIVVGSTCFDVTYFNTCGRFTTLLLKQMIMYDK